MINKEKSKNYKFLSQTLENKEFPLLFENPNFPYLIIKKDICHLSLIIKLISRVKIRNLKYMSKKIYNIKNKCCFKKIVSLKDYCKKLISLSFIYLYELYDSDKYYKLLFKLIINIFKSNSIFNNDDILEMIHYNIVYNLIKINNSDKISLFNISINSLISIICNEFQKNQLNILFNILDSIKKLLSEKTLFIFKSQYLGKNKVISIIKINEIISSPYFIKNNNDKDVIKVINKIKEIFYLIYAFNINKNYNDKLLENLRNAFIELKGEKYSKEKIINALYKINNEINLINDIFSYEDNIISDEFKDKFMPKRYFLFSKSNKSGISYNPNISLVSHNFTLIFSFKQYE